MPKRYSTSLGFRLREPNFNCPYCLDILHHLTKSPSAEIEGKDRPLHVRTSCEGCAAVTDLILQIMEKLRWAGWDRHDVWDLRVRRESAEAGRVTVLAIARHPSRLGIHYFEIYRPDTGHRWAILGLDSYAAFNVLESQITRCISQHQKCAANLSVPLPTRILDVESLRLYQPSDHARDKYISLSHCWGKTQLVRTLQSNLSDFVDRGIPWSSLSRTFQEAVLVTRRLRVRYIWIDSLCIVQDDLDDWEREAERMADIYQNAYVTLAATSSPDGSGGLFRHGMEWIHRPSGLRARWTDGHLHHVPDGADPWHDYRDLSRTLPLLSRGWCFQERILSTRVLHFRPNGVMLECNSGSFCECGKANFTSLKKMMSKNLEAAGSLYDAWTAMTTVYSGLSLTVSSDKLPAFAGIARSVARRYGLNEVADYVAGMWLQNLGMELLWFTSKPAATRPSEYRSPSWSWASVDSSVSHFALEKAKAYYMWYYRPEKAFCIRFGRDPLGRVSGGGLSLSGMIEPMSTEPGSVLHQCLQATRRSVQNVACFFDVDPVASGLGESILSGRNGTSHVYRVLLMHDSWIHKTYYLLVHRSPRQEQRDYFERIGMLSELDETPPELKRGDWSCITIL